MSKKQQSVSVNNPLTSRFSFVVVKEGQFLGTKVPFILYTDHVLKSYDLIYSSYEVDELNQVLPGAMLNEVVYIIGYTQEEVRKAIDVIGEVTTSIALTPYKHPTREEYALPWSLVVIEKLMPEPPQSAYKEFYENAVVEGRVKTKTEMLANGWV